MDSIPSLRLHSRISKSHQRRVYHLLEKLLHKHHPVVRRKSRQSTDRLASWRNVYRSSQEYVLEYPRSCHGIENRQWRLTSHRRQRRPHPRSHPSAVSASAFTLRSSSYYWFSRMDSVSLDPCCLNGTSRLYPLLVDLFPLEHHGFETNSSVGSTYLDRSNQENHHLAPRTGRRILAAFKYDHSVSLISW